MSTGTITMSSSSLILPPEVAAAKQHADRYAAHSCYQITKRATKSCRISHPAFCDEHARTLAFALLRTKQLRKLDISNCPKLTGQGISVICHALKQSNVVSHLSIKNVSIGDEGLQSIINDLLLPLEDNEGKEEASGCTTATSHVSSLKWLCLEESGVISDNAWNKFFNNTCWWKLTSLDLSRNSLSHDTVLALANGLGRKDSLLTSLILSDNPIGDDGMEVLCQQGLHQNQSVVLLAVGNCQISNQGMHALARVMRDNCGLQRLYTFGNPKIDAKKSAEYLEIQYWLELNMAGRSFLRANGDTCPHPSLLARMFLANKSNNDRPEILFGLLQDLPPHMWVLPPAENNDTEFNNTRD